MSFYEYTSSTYTKSLLTGIFDVFLSCVKNVCVDNTNRKKKKMYE